MATTQTKLPYNGNALGDILMVLQKVGLEKHFSHIFKKGVNWDSFTHLTAEDLQILGITDPKEIDALVEELSDLKLPSNDCDEPINLDVISVLGDTVKTIRRLRGGMFLAKKELEEYDSVGTMIDSQTRTTNILKKLLMVLDLGTDKLEKEIEYTMQALPKNKHRNRGRFLFSWKNMKEKLIHLVWEKVMTEAFHYAYIHFS